MNIAFKVLASNAHFFSPHFQVDPQYPLEFAIVFGKGNPMKTEIRGIFINIQIVNTNTLTRFLLYIDPLMSRSGHGIEEIAPGKNLFQG